MKPENSLLFSQQFVTSPSPESY